MFTPKTFYNLSAHLSHAVFLWFFYKRKGYPVDQKLDVIEKNRGHFRIQRPKVSQKQVPDLHCKSAKIVFPSVILMHMFPIKNHQWHKKCRILTKIGRVVLRYFDSAVLNGHKKFEFENQFEGTVL